MQCTMQMWHSGESECRDKCGHPCIIKIRSLCLWWQAVCHLIRGYARLYLELLLIWILFLVIVFSPSCLSVNFVYCEEGTRSRAFASCPSLCRFEHSEGGAPHVSGRVAIRKVKFSFLVLPRREFLEIFQEGKTKTCDGFSWLLCENWSHYFTSHSVSSKRKETVMENPSWKQVALSRSPTLSPSLGLLA